MAALRYHAVPGGGESSDSGDEWDIGDHRELSQRLNSESITESSEDSLKNALTAGNVKLVEDLLDSGINVECCFRFGWTPLMYGASIGNLEMVRVLLDRGANANFERDTFTVLMSACTAHASEENIVKCVELLLSRNVDPNVCCRKKMTAVMLAASKGHTQVVTLLVAHGADINAQDESGFTGLTWAAHSGHKSTVLKMLELGADMMLSTKTGSIAADIARQNNHLEIFSILTFSGNQNNGKFNLSKEEAMYKYLREQPEASTNYSCSPSSDLEVFLHGLGLEHLARLFKENDLTLRQLLCLEESEFQKAGVTDEDCKKIMAAMKEIHVEETKLEKLPSFSELESSDELFAFLLKLNRQCNAITHAVVAVSGQIPLNPQKVVLEWDSSQNYSGVCEDIIMSVTDLNKEVCRLQDLLKKFQYGQKNSPCRILPLEEQQSWRWWKSRRITLMAILGYGCPNTRGGSHHGVTERLGSRLSFPAPVPSFSSVCVKVPISIKWKSAT
ncbi:ankyrin repeat, SAM and basic leucine zipper domain-containing protein 1 isoform X2 [Hyla sarda]|uniref:ankyrin repeat, SAM and basic leucine zipper domain-containing protein 1 isoform X2 n=1 Tax=Hyla sarda TaxID=327740 RepID=UPI0024C458CA|nr:ankyrin repeat, SAM and basic leucine zipper domain-containing protein 1 isoform X2 [Hyla sarda]